ncbi:hypothetical protein JRQ81_012555, partial [Phrynocephalus forsythii]
MVEQKSANDFRLQKMIEGWSKERVYSPDTRTTISLQILCALSAAWIHICSNDYEVTMFHTASVIAFFTALR